MKKENKQSDQRLLEQQEGQHQLPERRILNHKIYLYLTEFFAGMSVMAVELGASRLLAPYFSSSQIVWTIIIGTIMIAMALGNIYGGRMADRDPNPDRLYGRIVIASIWIALIPVLGKYIILGISALLVFTISTNFLIWAAFATCMVLFVFPLFLLGTVTPSLVKYTVNSLDDSGRTVGTLGAFNTIGSIIGTFLPTFITIPAVGTSVTFLIFAGILLLLAFLYFVANRMKSRPVAVAVLILLIACIFGSSDHFAFWEDDLVYEGESVYNYLQVNENEEQVSLLTNVLFGVQSVYQKDQGLTGTFCDYALAGPLMAGQSEKERLDVLMLGVGAGTYASQCEHYFDNVQVEGVEIDGKITELANTYFDMPQDVKVTTYDGRAFLEVSDQKYDVIFVDAYQDITIPFQMSSVEFFTLVREHLTEDGVMVVNLNMWEETEGDINAHLMDTIAQVFPNIYTTDVASTTNRELFASQSEDLPQKLQSSIPSVQDGELRILMRRVSTSLQSYEAGRYIMTDDKAPVELLGMRVIDDLIREEVRYYKEIYHKEGLNGVLQAFE